VTVARLEDNELTVAIIPHTYEHTNVNTWEAGTDVNLEFDMIGKYVVRALQQTDETPDPDALARQWLDRG
jgi:riboflavin synthase